MKNWKKIAIIIVSITLILTMIDIFSILNYSKPIFAIKKDNVYKGLFYNTYICDEHSIALIKSKTEKFNCSINTLEESNYNIVELENISMSIMNVTPNSAKILIKDTNSEPYVYGQWYTIEKQIEGKWYKVSTNSDNYGFNDIAYMPNPKGELEFELNWNWLYGKLDEGNYRIIKQANEKYISIEFKISN